MGVACKAIIYTVGKYSYVLAYSSSRLFASSSAMDTGSSLPRLSRKESSTSPLNYTHTAAHTANSIAAVQQ